VPFGAPTLAPVSPERPIRCPSVCPYTASELPTVAPTVPATVIRADNPRWRPLQYPFLRNLSTCVVPDRSPACVRQGGAVRSLWTSSRRLNDDSLTGGSNGPSGRPAGAAGCGRSPLAPRVRHGGNGRPSRRRGRMSRNEFRRRRGGRPRFQVVLSDRVFPREPQPNDDTWRFPSANDPRRPAEMRAQPPSRDPHEVAVREYQTVSPVRGTESGPATTGRSAPPPGRGSRRPARARSRFDPPG